jgi:nicotinate phosphoribosyltransferase
VATQLAGRGGHLASIRLDSGDLLELSRDCRAVLDEAGLPEVRIFASGSLDEAEIARLLAAGAPIDAFGVGSRLGVSADAPYLDMAYKLVEFDGEPTLKLSTGKATLPGKKQIWRGAVEGRCAGDVLALELEDAPPDAEPLLHLVLRDGARVDGEGLAAARERAARERAALPAALRRVHAESRPVTLSSGLIEVRDRAIANARALNVP